MLHVVRREVFQAISTLAAINGIRHVVDVSRDKEWASDEGASAVEVNAPGQILETGKVDELKFQAF